MTEQEFLKFHSGYFGEEVDKIGQIVMIKFTGEELFEYVNQALSMSGVGDMFICANKDLEKGKCLDQCIACFKVEFECK